MALAAGCALALSRPEVFVRLFMRFDVAWLGVIELRNSYVFLDQWGSTAWGGVLFMLVVLGLAAREPLPGLKRLTLAMLGTMLALLVLSWFGAGIWRNVLLTQL